MDTQNGGSEKTIGDIIRRANNLSPEQMDGIIAHQREHNVKFGEAAVALGYANREDVLWALSQQFHYPYSKNRTDNVSTELVVATSPFSEQAESFRDIRSQLISQTLSTDGLRRAISVVSPNFGDGKSYFAANLAVSFSQLGGRCLLVDADMRSPRQHEIFSIEASGGLSGILSGRSETNVIRPVDALPSLYVLPVGVTPPNPLELVQRPAFSLLVQELLQKFDYVIVDTPAARHGSDAKVIASVCGAAVLVGRRNHVHMADLKGLSESLKKAKVKMPGVILNEY